MLRKRKEQTTAKLVGVNRIADPNKLKLGIFQSLENFIPGKRYKIKKKRGPIPLISTADVLAPSLCSVNCDDLSERGQVELGALTAYDQDGFLGGNQRTGWGAIFNGEVYTLVGAAGCDGGNMGYNDGCCQINHWTDESTVTALPCIDVVGPPNLAAINIAPGWSDEQAFFIPSVASPSNHLQLVFPARNTSTMIKDVGGGAYLGSAYWVKKDNQFILLNAQFGPSNPRLTAGYNATTGDWIWATDNLQDYETHNGWATDNYLYTLSSGFQNSATDKKRIAKLDITDGALLSLFDITNITPISAVGISDDIIYILAQPSGASGTVLYYLKNFSELVYVGRFSFPSLAFGAWSYFNNSQLYFGINGFGTGSVQIFKTLVPCPSSPRIATISTESTVAHGASISATWNDILLPASDDVISLRPAPTGGDLGFSGSSLTDLSTGSLASGVLPFAIPGGTTPGDYILQLCTDNGLTLIATSNVFTVT